MKEQTEFIKVYYEVFDEKGHIMACGRDKCKELIALADLIENENHGNKETGFLNVSKIRSLKNRIMAE